MEPYTLRRGRPPRQVVTNGGFLLPWNFQTITQARQYCARHSCNVWTKISGMRDVFYISTRGRIARYSPIGVRVHPGQPRESVTR